MTNNNFEKRGNPIQKIITELIVLNPPNFGESNYCSLDEFKDKLIFIKKDKNVNQKEDNLIPCLFYRKPNSSNFLIYFHGNSEDIFQIEFYGLDFRSHLEMNIIIVEYPSYSIYSCQNKSSNASFSDALRIYEWIHEEFKHPEKQIFVCGRSLGTSPAIFLASKKKTKALFLISPFFSLKEIGKKYKISLSCFLENIFESYKYLKNIRCPVLFIHGKKDDIIPYKHSENLKKELKENNSKVIAELELNENMSHNKFDLKEDIINPINNFIQKHKLKNNNNNINNLTQDNLNELYKIPQVIDDKIKLKLFNLDNFHCYKIIEKKNTSFLKKLIDESILLISGSIISFYNQRNFNLDYEINIDESQEGMKVTSLLQLENQNLIFGTNLGYIFIYEKDQNLDEYKKKREYKLINDEIYKIDNDEIYKIDKICPNLICLLSKNFIYFYDINFNKIKHHLLENNYYDFIHIYTSKLALLSQNNLSVCEFFENGKIFKAIDNHDNIETINNRNVLIEMNNKYIIIGGKKYIYYLDYTQSENNIQKENINWDISFIHKINDELLLASTNNGDILQIKINKKGGDMFTIIKNKNKNLINKKINSLLLKNAKNIVLANEDCVEVLTIDKNPYEQSCNLI